MLYFSDFIGSKKIFTQKSIMYLLFSVILCIVEKWEKKNSWKILQINTAARLELLTVPVRFCQWSQLH